MREGKLFGKVLGLRLPQIMVVFSVEVNESPVLPSVDTYNSKLSMMTVELGILELKKGENFLKLVQLDKNEKAVNSLIGLDYLTVEKVK